MRPVALKSPRPSSLTRSVSSRQSPSVIGSFAVGAPLAAAVVVLSLEVAAGAVLEPWSALWLWVPFELDVFEFVDVSELPLAAAITTMSTTKPVGTMKRFLRYQGRCAFA